MQLQNFSETLILSLPQLQGLLTELEESKGKHALSLVKT